MGPGTAVIRSRPSTTTPTSGASCCSRCAHRGQALPQRRPDRRPARVGVEPQRRQPRALTGCPEGDRGRKTASVVYVAEGEKDVHALEAAGGVATCNPGGAGKWRPEYGEYLAGIRHVVIVADRDQPGRKHAHRSPIPSQPAPRHRAIRSSRRRRQGRRRPPGRRARSRRASGNWSPRWCRRCLSWRRRKKKKKSAGLLVPSADPVMFVASLARSPRLPRRQPRPIRSVSSHRCWQGPVRSSGRGPHVRIGNTPPAADLAAAAGPYRLRPQG